MTKRKGFVGRQVEQSSDRYLSPSQPYTGDGCTRRKIFDGLEMIFRRPDGKRVPKRKG